MRIKGLSLLDVLLGANVSSITRIAFNAILSHYLDFDAPIGYTVHKKAQIPHARVFGVVQSFHERMPAH